MSNIKTIMNETLCDKLSITGLSEEDFEKFKNIYNLYKDKKISKDQALCQLKEIKFETHTFERISNK